MSAGSIAPIGGPTVLLETGGWRLLADPTFDAPGRRYAFGRGDVLAQAGRARDRSARRRAGRRGPAEPRNTTATTSTLPGARCCRRSEGQANGVLWISGETVLYDGLREAARRLHVDVALLHLGGVRFAVTGPVRYAMTAAEAIELCALLRPRVTIPIHYEGWSRFREGRDATGRELARAPDDVRRRVRWLPTGVPTDVAAEPGLRAPRGSA